MPRAEIDLGALEHNLRRVRELTPGRPVMAVVKADAYGHGLGVVAPALADADALAVARVAEGVAARRLQPRKRIIVLEGAFGDASTAAASQYRLELVVHQAYQIDALENLDREGLKVWLKIDSGMHRLGFGDDAAHAYQRLVQCGAVDRPPGLLTHLARADEPDHPMTPQQVAVFDERTRDLPGEISIGNSAAVVAWSDLCKGWVRPGLMLYGISPIAGASAADHDLRPVMTLRTRLIAVRRVRSGATVGYGGTWRATRDTCIGTAAVGYGDGYPGNLPNGTPVLVGGRRVALAGRVSMDMIAVDLGPEPKARVGDDVVLWGSGLPVEEIARASGRIAYEVVCGVSQRVPRVPTGSLSS